MDWMSQYLKGLKEYARDYVLENTGLKVLALLITGVLWLSIASRPVSEVALNGVPIVFHNLSESPNLIVSKYPALFARVYLEGSRDVIDSLRPGQLLVIADMSGIESGIRVIDLEVDSKLLPANVKVKGIEPRRITVTVERVVEKEVPITPRFEGEPPQGFQLVDWQIVPPTVKIAAAESQIREINQVSTETVRLSDRTDSFNEQVAIDFGSTDLNISGNSGGGKVTLIVNIGEVRKERVINDVPVTLSGAPPRAKAFPKFVSVTVYGPRSKVDALDVGDISAVIEYQPGSTVFIPKVTLPGGAFEGIALRSVEPQKVRVR